MNRTIPFIVKWICSVFLLISSLQDILYNFSILDTSTEDNEEFTGVTTVLSFLMAEISYIC